jgi:hypothetical protein
MACTGVAGPGPARPRPQGGGRIEDADARPPHLKGVRALGLLSVSAGFWLDSGWTLQLLPRRRQDPSIQKASQADGKKRPKMKPNIGENKSKMSQNRSEIEQK